MMENIDDLIESLADDAEPVMPAPNPFMTWLKWMGMAAAYIFVALLISGHRHDLAARLHSPLFLAEMATLAGIVCTTALSASLLAFPDLYQRGKIVFLPVIMFAGFALVMFICWEADHPPSPLPVHSYQCTLSISLLSILPMFWIFHALRKQASTHAQWTGVNAVLYAFGIGAIWLRLDEQTNSIVHVLEWHYLPMLAVGLIGLRFGRIFLKW